ncbi:MAG: TonB-dependent receptor [Bacteroidia bacterium]
MALFVCVCSSMSFAQTAVSGYITDIRTGETLIGAAVFNEAAGVGTYSNEYGFYSLTAPAGVDSFAVTARYAGYLPNKVTVLVKGKKDVRLDVGLTSEDYTTEDVVITAEKSNKEKVNSTQMSLNTLTAVEAKRIPVIFGEVDILKTLQLKPGVQSGGEGFSGLYVRGGGPDQNLIVLDEAIVYNANHLFGLFSTFNADAVKDVRLYKGGFPAQFGGRLSSVVDVRLKDGSRERLTGQGGIGLIASRLTLEGPFAKKKGSFIVSGRRTYFDIFTRLINSSNEDDPDFDPIPDYYFYDLNTKVNYDLGEKDRVFASGYFGKDVFGFNDESFDFGFDWGNATGTVRWNHIFNPRLFSNTTATFSDYRYNINGSFAESFEFNLSSSIRDYGLKTDFYYRPGKGHTVRFGASGIRHRFDLGRAEFTSNDTTASFTAGERFFATELGAYVSDDWEVNDRLSLNGGIRVSAFLSADGKAYGGFEPRFSAKYSLTSSLSVKASYARMYQYIHLVSNSGASLPTDVWYPSNESVPAQSSQQVAGGWSLAIGKDFLLTNEYYYKWIANAVDFRDNANLFLNENLADEFTFGKGWAYGTEIYLEKKRGKLTGWIGYTLSWAWRKFDGSQLDNPEPDKIINDGANFHPRHDRRHDVSLVLTWQATDRLSIGGTWIYGTGNAYSLPIGRSFITDPATGDPRVIPIYGDRNSFRLAAYHRSDFSIVWKLRKKTESGDLTFSLYNTYNRRNAFFVYNEQLENRFQPRQVTLFPVIPSLTYNFKF